MFRVIDKRPHCGKVAFYFERELKRGEMISASNVILNDGTRPSPEDQIICGSCNQPFISGNIPIQMETWKDWFIQKKEKNES